MKSVCIFCGSADGVHPDYYASASQMGAYLAQKDIQLIYGAGKTGLMGAVADGVLIAGGEVTGVVPENLNTSVLIHANLTRLEVVKDIQQRQARMNALADALIALPGGYGTFDELFEALTWAQIGLQRKPIGLLNIRGYFDPLMDMIRRALDEKFIYPEHMDMLTIERTPEGLIQSLENFKYPENLDRWVNRDDR
ncbi:TIGR00730 family protein [Longilinea arvoryzae]|uniref:Cytokinin riboside 5'-monophosphate phosphoribohydrolase n=1 Tax=Longilinea arvoryzae TaxID=360412 RepID=A0A0S7BKC8_9CHLR|nr:TIGR00730 family Rossman fold protein [Longilinea arvoryzae]GAP14674.1 TIGR00730 family protein [Longilinea arvoryzae]